MTAELATSPCARPSPGVNRTERSVVHSDRGGQFRSRAFRAVLKADELTGSMGRVASAGDNAAMESFYLATAEERPRPEALGEPGRPRHAIVYWIEHTYNSRRRQRGLGKLTPVEFELAFAAQEAAAV